MSSVPTFVIVAYIYKVAAEHPGALTVLAGILYDATGDIGSGEVLTKRDPRGRRHRVYVMLYDDPLSATEIPQTELAVAQERKRCLEQQVAFPQGQLEQKQRHNAGLLSHLAAKQGSAEKATGHSWWW